MAPPKGDGRLDNPDRSELCEDIDLLMVLAGQPTTNKGQNLIMDHEASCTWCARSGRWQTLISIMIIRDAQHEANLQAVFGPIVWAD